MSEALCRDGAFGEADTPDCAGYLGGVGYFWGGRGHPGEAGQLKGGWGTL